MSIFVSCGRDLLQKFSRAQPFGADLQQNPLLIRVICYKNLADHIVDGI